MMIDVLESAAWATIVGTILLFALGFWMNKHFIPRETLENRFKEMERLMNERHEDQDATIQKLENEILTEIRELRLDRKEDLMKFERVFATQNELNGLGRRVDETRQSFHEVLGDVRAATMASNQASADVSHLAKRLEDVIQHAITRLEKQLDNMRVVKDAS